MGSTPRRRMASTITGEQNTKCGLYTSQRSASFKTNQELVKVKKSCSCKKP